MVSIEHTKKVKELNELIDIRNQLLPKCYKDSEKYTILSKAVRHLNKLIELLEEEV
jgi:hypothetical protein